MQRPNELAARVRSRRELRGRTALVGKSLDWIGTTSIAFNATFRSLRPFTISIAKPYQLVHSEFAIWTMLPAFEKASLMSLTSEGSNVATASASDGAGVGAPTWSLTTRSSGAPRPQPYYSPEEIFAM